MVQYYMQDHKKSIISITCRLINVAIVTIYKYYLHSKSSLCQSYLSFLKSICIPTHAYTPTNES